eukprot:TRINITY_DN1340_c1_g1_i1.p1 TRINITY_DN1340_c1_g1~~TRINITY_DN1340_c1_g1_i1.p1  ORF type:complete len:607 (-),score=107.47 TRINITY_DN1340_c1_g1_i1:280-2100(-)
MSGARTRSHSGITTVLAKKLTYVCTRCPFSSSFRGQLCEQLTHSKMEFAIRLRKCTNIGSRYTDQAMLLTVSDAKGDLFISEGLLVDSTGSMDFFMAKSASLVFSPFKAGKKHLFLTFKLQETSAKKVRGKLVQSWKVDVGAFKDRSVIEDFEITGSEGEPTLVVNILDLVYCKASDPGNYVRVLNQMGLGGDGDTSQEYITPPEKKKRFSLKRKTHDNISPSETRGKDEEVTTGSESEGHPITKSMSLVLPSRSRRLKQEDGTETPPHEVKEGFSRSKTAERLISGMSPRKRARNLARSGNGRRKKIDHADNFEASESGTETERSTDDEREKEKEKQESEIEKAASVEEVVDEGIIGSKFTSQNVVADDVLCDSSYKIIIIGDSGSGKTSVLERWLHNSFSFGLPQTVNVDIGTKTFQLPSGMIIQFQFWDTAGQERFSSMARSYYTSAKGAVLMYNITERETLRNIPRWLDAFKMISPTAEIILIGNKNDLESQRQVSTEEGMRVAKEEGISFLETSAKSGSNCLRAMQTLLDVIYERATREELEAASKPVLSVRDPTTEVIKITEHHPEPEVAEESCACGGGAFSENKNSGGLASSWDNWMKA